MRHSRDDRIIAMETGFLTAEGRRRGRTEAAVARRKKQEGPWT